MRPIPTANPALAPNHRLNIKQDRLRRMGAALMSATRASSCPFLDSFLSRALLQYSPGNGVTGRAKGQVNRGTRPLCTQMAARGKKQESTSLESHSVPFVLFVVEILSVVETIGPQLGQTAPILRRPCILQGRRRSPASRVQFQDEYTQANRAADHQAIAGPSGPSALPPAVVRPGVSRFRTPAAPPPCFPG